MSGQEADDGQPERDELDSEFEALMSTSSLGAPRVLAASGAMDPEVRDVLRRGEAYGELSRLLAQPDLSGAQLRRVGELAELVFDLEAAVPWLRMAAAAGDRDAADVLGVLDDEAE